MPIERGELRAVRDVPDDDGPRLDKEGLPYAEGIAAVSSAAQFRALTFSCVQSAA